MNVLTFSREYSTCTGASPGDLFAAIRDGLGKFGP